MADFLSSKGLCQVDWLIPIKTKMFITRLGLGQLS